MEFSEREAARVLWLGSVSSWCTPELILRYFIPSSAEDVTAVRLIHKSATELFPYAFITFRSIDAALRCFRRYNNTTANTPALVSRPAAQVVVRLSHSRCVCRRTSELASYLSPSGNHESLTGLAELAVDVIATISQFATRLPAKMQLGWQLAFTLNIPGGLTASKTALSGGQAAYLRGSGEPHLVPQPERDLRTLSGIGNLPGALTTAHETVTRDGSLDQTQNLIQKFQNQIPRPQWWPQCQPQIHAPRPHPIIPSPIADHFSGSESTTFTPSFSSYSTPPEPTLYHNWNWALQPVQEPVSTMQTRFSDTTLIVTQRAAQGNQSSPQYGSFALTPFKRHDAFGLS